MLTIDYFENLSKEVVIAYDSNKKIKLIQKTLYKKETRSASLQQSCSSDNIICELSYIITFKTADAQYHKSKKIESEKFTDIECFNINTAIERYNTLLDASLEDRVSISYTYTQTKFETHEVSTVTQFV